MSDDDRVQRVALTEAAFRIANERIAGWEESRSSDAAQSYYCECALVGCREAVRLTRSEYEAVRAEPRRFFVVKGHIVEDLETEVASHDGYSVIEKPSSLLGLLREADPRSDATGPASDTAAALADEIGQAGD
jgi:hypothetical protein